MDNFYVAMRLFCGICALFGGAVLIYSLITGQARFALDRARRGEDPKSYWIALARFTCLFVGMALAATVVRDKQIGAVIGLSVFLPGLIAALITGRFEWEADGKRIDSPRRFLGWAALYGGLSAIMTVMLIWP